MPGQFAVLVRDVNVRSWIVYDTNLSPAEAQAAVDAAVQKNPAARIAVVQLVRSFTPTVQATQDAAGTYGP